MSGGRLVAILALALATGPVAAQEAPPLPVTEAPADEGQADQAPPRPEPIVVSSPVQAQAVSVVTVDQDRLFAGSAWGRRMQAEFEQSGNALADENERLAAQLSDEEAKLTQQRAALDPAEFRRLAEAFDARATEIRRERAQAVQDLNTRIDTEQAAFFQAVVPLIGQMMQERGAVLVLDRRTALLSAEGIDITSELIARVDAELGDGADRPAATPTTDPAPAGDGSAPVAAPGTGGD